jgi:hypothetical protein
MGLSLGRFWGSREVHLGRTMLEGCVEDTFVV